MERLNMKSLYYLMAMAFFIETFLIVALIVDEQEFKHYKESQKIQMDLIRAAQETDFKMLIAKINKEFEPKEQQFNWWTNVNVITNNYIEYTNVSWYSTTNDIKITTWNYTNILTITNRPYLVFPHVTVVRITEEEWQLLTNYYYDKIESHDLQFIAEKKKK